MMTGSSGCPEEPMSLIEEMLEHTSLAGHALRVTKASPAPTGISVPGSRMPHGSRLRPDPQVEVCGADARGPAGRPLTQGRRTGSCG